MRRAPARPAPSDAAALSALLARADLAPLEARRRELMAAIAQVRPRRSAILEGALKRLTHEILRARVAAMRGRP